VVPSIPLPSALKVTVVEGDTVLLIACRIVVPGVVAPLLPCHEIVQPPLCLPRSLALLPATKILLAVFGNGRIPLARQPVSLAQTLIVRQRR
jgi:hypothetical protein